MGNPGKSRGLMSDFWGGAASMLVAFPSAIAFGLVVYSALPGEAAARGAIYGILGTLALGIVAPLFGGRPGAVSAPCAPAAAVLAAYVAQLAGGGTIDPERVGMLLAAVTLAAAALQFLFGSIGGGRLIKFIPYPVVAGYLAAVGLLILGGQIPKLVGLPKGAAPWPNVLFPGSWDGRALAIGLVTIATTLLAPRLTRKVPASILGLGAGIATYGGIAAVLPGPDAAAGNPLVIGPLGGETSFSLGMFADRFKAATSLRFAELQTAAVPAMTLAVLLSIDTLKTGVLVDALTQTRHDSDRELRGQGLGNAASALIGGMAGAATAGPTLVNVTAGGVTRRSGVMMGVMSLLAFVALGGLIQWVPVAALAGILVVVGIRMVDPHSFHLLRHRNTALDFAVVAAVVGVALTVGLVQAAAVGLALAVVLFVRDQVRDAVIRRRLLGSAISSKKRRHHEQSELLAGAGETIAVVELQGALFFGTTDQLFGELAEDLRLRRFLILDLSRVRSLDFTAGRMLDQIHRQLEGHGGSLLLTGLERPEDSGHEIRTYLIHFGVLDESGGSGTAQRFDTQDDALAWAEDRLLEEAGLLAMHSDPPLDLTAIHPFDTVPAASVEALRRHVQELSFATGELIFSRGEQCDALYLIRSGAVRIELELEIGTRLHVASFDRGALFGEMAFLDRTSRSADAVAERESTLYRISRAEFDAAAVRDPALGAAFFDRIAVVLAKRLRQTDQALRSVQDA